MIKIDWQYFLGTIGALIGIAYYVNGQFTKLETSMEWLKEALLELKLRLTDQRNNHFDGRRQHFD